LARRDQNDAVRSFGAGLLGKSTFNPSKESFGSFGEFFFIDAVSPPIGGFKRGVMLDTSLS